MGVGEVLVFVIRSKCFGYLLILQDYENLRGSFTPVFEGLTPGNVRIGFIIEKSSK